MLTRFPRRRRFNQKKKINTYQLKQPNEVLKRNYKIKCISRYFVYSEKKNVIMKNQSNLYYNNILCT